MLIPEDHSIVKVFLCGWQQTAVRSRSYIWFQYRPDADKCLWPILAVCQCWHYTTSTKAVQVINTSMSQYITFKLVMSCASIRYPMRCLLSTQNLRWAMPWVYTVSHPTPTLNAHSQLPRDLMKRWQEAGLFSATPILTLLWISNQGSCPNSQGLWIKLFVPAFSTDNLHLAMQFEKNSYVKLFEIAKQSSSN